MGRSSRSGVSTASPGADDARQKVSRKRCVAFSAEMLPIGEAMGPRYAAKLIENDHRDASAREFRFNLRDVAGAVGACIE
jgi:hypothetical protein